MAAAAAAATAVVAAEVTTTTIVEPLVMFIIIRKDLIKGLNWPMGAVITQACHAATAAIHQFRAHPDTQLYLDKLGEMHKVTLETSNLNSLEKVAAKLESKGVGFCKWLEQPENIFTCLATIPVKKSQLGECLKGCQLWR